MPAPEPGQTWGILGGTFDPVHLGHLSLATDMQKAQKLDGVLLVPAFDPPHRAEQPHASFEDRVAMLTLATEDVSGLIISRIEESLGRPGYTLETVRALGKQHDRIDFRFIVGADNLNLLRTWHRWETVLDEIRLLVGCRPGADLEPIADLPRARIDLVETSMIDLSSTEIRDRVNQGIDPEELSRMVPPKVATYILERNLYR